MENLQQILANDPAYWAFGLLVTGFLCGFGALRQFSLLAHTKWYAKRDGASL